MNRYAFKIISMFIGVLVFNNIYAASSQKDISEVDIFLRSFVKKYEEGNLNNLMKFYEPNAVVVGTGSDEILQGRGEIYASFKRDFSQHSTAKIKLDCVSIDVKNNIAFATYKLVVNVRFKDKAPLHSLLRFTVALVKHKNNWLIQQSHLSAAMDNQKAGESFPST